MAIEHGRWVQFFNAFIFHSSSTTASLKIEYGVFSSGEYHLPKYGLVKLLSVAVVEILSSLQWGFFMQNPENCFTGSLMLPFDSNQRQTPLNWHSKAIDFAFNAWEVDCWGVWHLCASFDFLKFWKKRKFTKKNHGQNYKIPMVL